MINDKYYNRAVVLSWVVIAIAAVLIIRLFYLQVIDKSTEDKADRNALYRQTVYPSRGLIYDRNDSLLVFNQSVYDVMIVFKEMGAEFDTLGFCQAMALTREEFQERMNDISNTKTLGMSEKEIVNLVTRTAKQLNEKESQLRENEIEIITQQYINLGFTNFQPSELAKILLIIFFFYISYFIYQFCFLKNIILFF